MLIIQGGCNNPPLGKYVWEKPSGEQGLKLHDNVDVIECTHLLHYHVVIVLAINYARQDLRVKFGPLTKFSSLVHHSFIHESTCNFD